ncbi:MAG: phosphopentomutase [Thermincola sp.]|jgi:phosphopentomutase|nr:phosphopentomutase [Thermincola sp.]MDT3703687.1 phosphopentomutase [Thermincola sp.]
MTEIHSVVIIVLDSLGVGELPDADKYGDSGSNTLGNIAKTVNGLKLTNLQKLGLGNIIEVMGVPPADKPLAAYGKAAEASAGKDTTTGHWEMSGLILDNPFPVFPHGFPPELIAQFEAKIGRKTLANEVASGTEIIARLGEVHMKTGYPIVYTSADSVFQIAAHEEVISVGELYEMCRIAREILTGPYAVGRVIARPFIGKPGAFKRTANRHDYSLAPLKPTILDVLKEKGLSVLAVGKINDIFAGRGITETVHTENNMDGVNKTLEFIKRNEKGLVFVNLVDFDSSYGHRNDAQGYADALAEFDARLPEILALIGKDKVLVITGDHGCDPTTTSTDHSREYVPLLVYGPVVKPGVSLGTRKTFADVAATVAEVFDVKIETGTSFLKDIL